jgi:hypothetical protein
MTQFQSARMIMAGMLRLSNGGITRGVHPTLHSKNDQKGWRRPVPYLDQP